MSDIDDLFFRKAEMADFDPIWEIIQQAKAQMRQLDEAYELLAPFKDVNSAIMALSVNKNEEAAAIMESVRSNSPQCEYVRAMVSARLGEDADALGHIAKAAEDVALRERAKIEYDFKPYRNCVEFRAAIYK